MTETPCKSAACRFVRPERTSESEIAQRTYRVAPELPSVDEREAFAKALRDLLTVFGVSLIRFAAMHDVNEKQASKWAEGRANYPGWGFKRLPRDMRYWLFDRVTAETASPMKVALGWLRREGSMRDVFEAQQELLVIQMAKAEAPR